MTIIDWIIRIAIFTVIAIAIIGTFQNIMSGIRADTPNTDRDQHEP